MLNDLALQRNGAKEKSWTRKVSPHYKDSDQHLKGLAGEYVVALALDSEIDQSITRHGDPGHDLLVDFRHRSNVPVGVKFCHRQHGHLYVAPNSRKDTEDSVYDFRCDLMVLVSGICTINFDNTPPTGSCFCTPETMDQQEFTIRGWVTRDQFYERRESRDWGYGECWFVKQKDLNPFEELVGYLTYD